jgi:hypothetical protein
MAANQNRKSLLTALHTVLSADPRGLTTPERARVIVLETLKEIMGA